MSRPIPEPGGPSHGRYRLGEVIGSGGFGQVHRAVDTLTGDVVAVKFVRALSAADLRRARRELAALRWLRLPGVVRLRDDGLEGASWFMVMDLVEGRRFDAFRGWSNVRPLALELLEILARVHLAGVVHRDLKPSNLVVTATGRVVVLDFGIAGGRAVPEVRGCPEGTPRYMAPEQVRGDPTDPRTDLFAVGMMIGELCPDLPPGPRRVVDAMRAHTVRDRPESALEAYRDLAGRSLFPAALDRAEPWTSEALGDLFQPTGDAFTHLRSDAVALVRERTQGDPGRVRRTLEQWILAGFVSWTDGGLVVDRLGLDRLAGGGSLDLLRGDPVVLAREAIGAAQVMRARGQVSPAIAVTDLVLPLAATIEGGDRFEAEAGLLKERVLAAIMLQSPAQLNLALYAIERAAPSPAVERLDALARAARSALRDELGPARAALRTVEPFADPELEVRRAAVLVRAAAIEGQAAEAQALEGLEGWAVGDPERAGLLAGWWGQHWYRAGRFREAAEAQQQAAASKRYPVARLSSTIGAAAAWLEVPDLGRAERLARVVVHEAAVLRHPRYEAYATWMLRAAAYRALRPEPLSPEMLAAVAELGADLEASFAMTEAATAYRAGLVDSCLASADLAARRFTEVGVGPGALLMRALAAFLHRDSDLSSAAAQAGTYPHPNAELQVLAFARWCTPAPPARWLARQRELAALRPRHTWSIRLDVLSVDEALAPSPPRVGDG